MVWCVCCSTGLWFAEETVTVTKIQPDVLTHWICLKHVQWNMTQHSHVQIILKLLRKHWTERWSATGLGLHKNTRTNTALKCAAHMHIKLMCKLKINPKGISTLHTAAIGWHNKLRYQTTGFCDLEMLKKLPICLYRCNLENSFFSYSILIDFLHSEQLPPP